MKKINNEFKFIFFFFIFFLIFLKQSVAYSFENYKSGLQYLINSLSPGQNIIYILCYILVFGVLFYFFWKTISISPFSGYVSFILSIGLVLILVLMRIIGRISTVFFNIFKYFIDKGLVYTILFLVSILIILLVMKYIFGWLIYHTKGSKEKRKKEKEKLERAEQKAFYKGLKGK